MEELRLEVGKKYLNGRGKSIGIVKHKPGLVYEFVGDNDETYTKFGTFAQHGDHPLEDLVKEVTTNSKP